MYRKQAQELLGSRVVALTLLDGFYVGVLTGVIAKKKRGWRAEVQIDGVLMAAIHYDAEQGVVRRGYRTGESVEFPGSRVELTKEHGTSYLEALEAAIRSVEQWLKNNPKSDGAQSQRQVLSAYQQALQSELQHLESGVWQLPQPRQPPQPVRAESTQLPLQSAR